jgi:hypothetical protein
MNLDTEQVNGEFHILAVLPAMLIRRLGEYDGKE